MSIEVDKMLLDSKERRLHQQQIFDLSGVIQFALIFALEKSAKTNGYLCEDDKGFDGWYKFDGSIDTRLIAEALAVVVKDKVVYDQAQQQFKEIIAGSRAAFA